MDISHDLISSIFIAKNIIDTNPKLITSLQLDRQFLGDKPFNIQDKVPLHTSIKNFIPVIKSVLRRHSGTENVIIKIYKVNASAIIVTTSRMAGIVAKQSESSYLILISEEESYCTQRLALCKELSQIYVGCIISEPLADPNNQILEATRELIHKFYSSDRHPYLTDKFTSSETFAHSIALELMIPYTLRDEIKKQLLENNDTMAIAERLFITKETLDEYWKTYFELTTPIYKML